MILIIVDLYELKKQFTIKVLAFYQDCVKNLLDSLAIRYVLGVDEPAASLPAEDVRRKPFRRFPYSLLYVIEVDRIRAVAVAQ